MIGCKASSVVVVVFFFFFLNFMKIIMQNFHPVLKDWMKMLLHEACEWLAKQNIIQNKRETNILRIIKSKIIKNRRKKKKRVSNKIKFSLICSPPNS